MLRDFGAYAFAHYCQPAEYRFHLAITWQPGFSLDCGKVASCQRQPQRKDPLSRYTFHVSCGALIEFSVLPHQKAAGIRAKAPLTLVLQSNVRMFVVLHVKGLKELAKGSREGLLSTAPQRSIALCAIHA